MKGFILKSYRNKAKDCSGYHQTGRKAMKNGGKANNSFNWKLQ